MSLLENLKKGFMDGLQSATDKTTEYTKIGRIKIDMLGLKKEIEEKFIELGGRVYHNAVENNETCVDNDMQIGQLILQIKELEKELMSYKDELRRIRDAEGIDLE